MKYGLSFKKENIEQKGNKKPTPNIIKHHLKRKLTAKHQFKIYRYKKEYYKYCK